MDITDLLSQFTHIQSLQGIILVVASLIVIGYILKSIPKIPNYLIPAIVISLGGVFTPMLVYAPEGVKNQTLTLALQGIIAGFAAWGAHKFVLKRLLDSKIFGDDSNPPAPPTALLLALLIPLAVIGCAPRQLEVGGVYNPGTPGQYADYFLDGADSSYKNARNIIDITFKWEEDNRAALWIISPNIKHAIDRVRIASVKADKEFHLMRRAYINGKTTESQDKLQTALNAFSKLATEAGALYSNYNK